jgi:hypothetical protein
MVSGAWIRTTSAAATHLATLPAGVARFVCRPFVGCSFFVRGAAALAGDFALLFG